jgi:hypothetical protein
MAKKVVASSKAKAKPAAKIAKTVKKGKQAGMIGRTVIG